jgi:hypothetical protein
MALRPLFSGRNEFANSGAWRRENTKLRLDLSTSLRGALATTQSTLPRGKMDCSAIARNYGLGAIRCDYGLQDHDQ